MKKTNTSGAQHKTDRWFVRKNGIVYGPVNLSELQTWATDGRVTYSDSISPDRIAWTQAGTLVELELNYKATSTKGEEIDPFHIEATAYFLRRGLISAESIIVNIETGQLHVVAQIPHARAHRPSPNVYPRPPVAKVRQANKTSREEPWQRQKIRETLGHSERIEPKQGHFSPPTSAPADNKIDDRSLSRLKDAQEQAHAETRATFSKSDTERAKRIAQLEAEAVPLKARLDELEASAVDAEARRNNSTRDLLRRLHEAQTAMHNHEVEQKQLAEELRKEREQHAQSRETKSKGAAEWDKRINRIEAEVKPLKAKLAEAQQALEYDALQKREQDAKRVKEREALEAALKDARAQAETARMEVAQLQDKLSKQEAHFETASAQAKLTFETETFRNHESLKAATQEQKHLHALLASAEAKTAAALKKLHEYEFYSEANRTLEEELHHFQIQAGLQKQTLEQALAAASATITSLQNDILTEKSKVLNSLGQGDAAIQAHASISTVVARLSDFKQRNLKDEYWISSPDGESYGPIDFSVLCLWAADCRLGPTYRVSTDQETWTDASRFEDLDMNWNITLGDGSEYGPVHVLALRELIEQDATTGISPIKNLSTGEVYAASDLGQLERAGLRNMIIRQASYGAKQCDQLAELIALLSEQLAGRRESRVPPKAVLSLSRKSRP